MTQSHTPTLEVDLDGFTILDQEGRTIATTNVAEDNKDIGTDTPNHAALIVKAVNCHEELVEALQEAREFIIGNFPQHKDRQHGLWLHINNVLAKAALAKAGA